MNWPVLLDLGTVKIYSSGLFAVLSFLWGIFVVSKKAREEHLSLATVYDSGVISLLAVVVIMRAAFFLGLRNASIEIGLIGGVLTGATFLSFREERKLFDVLDLMVLGGILALAWEYLGFFWSGAARIFLYIGNFGFAIDRFLLLALYFLTGFLILWRLETIYRTFMWYRAGKSSAKSGFVVGTALFLVGLRFLILPGSLVGVVFGWVMVVGSIILIYLRSGRKIGNDLRQSYKSLRRHNR